MTPELIDHNVRVWAAEVENADRLSQKSSVLVSGLGLLFGLGLFKLDWTMGKQEVSRIHSLWADHGVKGFLILALLSFSAGLSLALQSIKLPAGRVRPGMTASDLLRFDKTTADAPPEKPEQANEIIFYLYVNAINELRAENRERRARLLQAERLFLFGLFAAMLAIVIYLIASYPSMI